MTLATLTFARALECATATMRRLAVLSPVITLSAVLAACAPSFSQLPHGASPAGADAVLVLGLPRGVAVEVTAGEHLYGDLWQCNGGAGLARLSEVKGFAVVRLPPRTGDQNYALTLIFPRGSPGGVFGQFAARRRQGTPVFDLAPGSVAYVGTLTLLGGGSYSAQIDMHDDVEGARAHIDTYYPSLRGRMRHIPATRMEVEVPCW